MWVAKRNTNREEENIIETQRVEVLSAELARAGIIKLYAHVNYSRSPFIGRAADIVTTITCIYIYIMSTYKVYSHRPLFGVGYPYLMDDSVAVATAVTTRSF